MFRWILPVAALCIFAVPAASVGQDERAGETKLFGLSGRGSRFVYVFDRSLSMEGPPLAAAKRELVTSLQQLDRLHQFQIVFYNERPRFISSSRMLFADENGIREAESFVRSIQAAGGTDHLQALKLALKLAPDVIFFLTDADEPPLTPRQLEDIRRDNAATAIHVIQFKAGGEPKTTNFLKQLADQNRGEYKFVDTNSLSASK